DKLFYDAATKLDQLNADEHAELMKDGSGRAVAAKRACAPSPSAKSTSTSTSTSTSRKPTARACQVAIAITAPARPAPYPFLVIIGVLGLGAAIAAAGALISRRAARIGMLAGVTVLAVPAMLWGAWIAVTMILVLGAGVALAQHRNLTDRVAAGLAKHRTALSFLAPAAAAMLVLVA